MTKSASVSTIYGNINDEQRKAIKDAIVEIDSCLNEIDDQKEQMKSIVDSVSELTNVPKKLFEQWQKHIIITTLTKK